jgi:hypothetical protein
MSLILNGDTGVSKVQDGSIVANDLFYGAGGVIESGSNANGNYIKFGDGTMICTFVATSSAATSTAIGALYYRTINNVVFPAAFVGNIPAISNASVDIGNYSIGAMFYAPSLTGFGAATLYGVSATSLIALGYVAIGRWK